MPRALIVLTGSNVWTMKDGTPHPTGFWAREFLEAYDAFMGGGLEVDIATPLGVKPTVDELSWYPPYNNDDENFIAQQKKTLESLAPILSAAYGAGSTQAMLRFQSSAASCGVARALGSLRRQSS